MKRSSVLAIIMLFGLCGIATSRNYISNQYRVRWSPYAHGLIGGYVKYSPYAKSFANTGLVYEHSRYSPYAKSFGNTGLVYDYVSYIPYALRYGDAGLVSQGASYPCYTTIQHTVGQPVKGNKSTTATTTQQNQAGYIKTRKVAVEQQKQRIKESNSSSHGPEEVISAYLKSKDINFRIDRIMRMQGKLISVNFLLADGNVMIKYWNPAEILALEQQPDHLKGFYQRYLESWKQYSGDYLAGGGQIFQIISDDNVEVLSELLDLELEHQSNV